MSCINDSLFLIYNKILKIDKGEIIILWVNIQYSKTLNFKHI